MEKAVFITKLTQLKYMGTQYTRLYYGNEFCQRLIPPVMHLERILCVIEKRKLNLSLVTPYVTNEGLEKVAALFELLKKRQVNCEVIVNDWGVLNLLNREYPGFTPVLGRMLTKQKRGPRIIKLLERKSGIRLIKSPESPKQKFYVLTKKLPLELDPYYKGSNTSSVAIIHNFLMKQRVKRIELDNVAQGLFLELPKEEIKASVYLPYVYISTTFFCPTAGCDREEESALKIKPCRKQCQKYVFKLRHKTMPKVIFLKGNTLFYKNPQAALNEFKALGIDRIVYAPEIPV